MDALRHFAETWLAYREGGGRSVFQTSWQDVCEAEGAMRQALEAEGYAGPTLSGLQPTPDPSLAVHKPIDGRIVSLQEENDRLRLQVSELGREITELRETRRLSPQAAVLDVTQTIAYKNASMNAPQDAIQAYRAGMVYAAQVIARLNQKT